MSRAADRLVIVKLGGSLVESGRAAELLAMIAQARRPLVLVPGGGAFADLVRAEQIRWRIDDAVAHRMALLAMEQVALLLAASGPRYVVCDSLAAISRALARRRIPVWAPSRLALGDPSIPCDWSITSDGLAAWLALRLRAAEVILLKSLRVDPQPGGAELARLGVVDPVFARLVDENRLPFRLIGPDEEDRLAALLRIDAAGAPVAAGRESVIHG